MKPMSVVLLLMGVFAVAVLVAGGVAVYSASQPEGGKAAPALIAFLTTFFGLIVAFNQVAQFVVHIKAILESSVSKLT